MHVGCPASSSSRVLVDSFVSISKLTLQYCCTPPRPDQRIKASNLVVDDVFTHIVMLSVEVLPHQTLSFSILSYSLSTCSVSSSGYSFSTYLPWTFVCFPTILPSKKLPMVKLMKLPKCNHHQVWGLSMAKSSKPNAMSNILTTVKAIMLPVKTK